MKTMPIALCAALLASAHASEPMPVRLYDVTTETGMPHLEENLRYATRHERRCLGPADLDTAFWILGHESLAGCRLVPDEAGNDGLVGFDLVCRNGHGTTGRALWRIERDVVHGTLDVKLGGKNMTFFQRITARPVGACQAR